jgi:hypothetical protein
VNGNDYPNLMLVVKTVLIVSHGNADCERGFSDITNLVDEKNSAIGLKMIHSRLTIKSGLGVFENQPAKVPVTQNLIKITRLAHKNYIKKSDKFRKKKKKKEFFILEKHLENLVDIIKNISRFLFDNMQKIYQIITSHMENILRTD